MATLEDHWEDFPAEMVADIESAVSSAKYCLDAAARCSSETVATFLAQM